jgi:hypothetical protein
MLPLAAPQRPNGPKAKNTAKIVENEFVVHRKAAAEEAHRTEGKT